MDNKCASKSIWLDGVHVDMVGWCYWTLSGLVQFIGLDQHLLYNLGLIKVHGGLSIVLFPTFDQ